MNLNKIILIPLYILLKSIMFPGCVSEYDRQITIPEHFEDTETNLLSIENYLGNTQNIHPKVLYFDNGWNGYRFWMVYTPYPEGDSKYENPSIAVSQDGIEWFTPEGLNNPLENPPHNGYNSDPHLVYNEENDLMEMWWRPYHEKKGDCIMRKTSSDGINWSESQTVVDYKEFTDIILSPAVWIEGDSYVMVFSNMGNLMITRCKKNEKGFNWSQPKTLPIEWGKLIPWHQDVIVNPSGGLEMVVCAYEKGIGNNNSADLYYVALDPELKETAKPTIILKRGEDDRALDHRSIYRSSLLRIKNKYYLYYSAIDKLWRRNMALIIIPAEDFPPSPD